MSEALQRHLDEVAARLDGPGTLLPPHYPTCLGCGPDAVQGYHLQAHRDGEAVVARHVFEVRHGGAPGIAHGGAVATVVDDVLGYVPYLVRVPAVTRRLEIDYLRPLLVGVPYELRGELSRREGRKLWVSCTVGDTTGTAVTARGLFVVVPVSHFSAATGQDAPIAP